MIRLIRSSAARALLLGGILSGTPLSAQVSEDSIAAWTRRLEAGTLEEKADAAGKLAQQDPSRLPTSAQSAIIRELDRINQVLFTGADVPGATELGSEGFGEFYLDLVIPTAHFNTPQARQALVRSVGVGGGIQRRVARQGDVVVPALEEMVRSNYEPGSALETLTLAWFWADSTGATLSDASRARITNSLLFASQSGDYSLRRAAASSLALLADPAFLPLAEALWQQAERENRRLLAAALRQDVIPGLQQAEAALSTSGLAARLARVTAAVCQTAQSGPRRGACEAIQNDLAAAREHLAGQRSGPARNLLETVIRRADRAREIGALDAMEHALIAGGARRLLARVAA